MPDITLTPLIGDPPPAPLVIRKPDHLADGAPNVIEMRWENPMRAFIDAVNAIAAPHVLQVRNRHGYYRCVCTVGAVLTRLTYTENVRFGGTRSISVDGVLQVATASIERGIDSLSLLFWKADDVYISGLMEIQTYEEPEPE